jgi:RDD family/Protein of unknown function (DUF2510)
VTQIAPGWYKDPADPTTQRYWDGEGWIGDPLPVDATPPPGPPGTGKSGPAVTLPPVRPAPPAGDAPPVGDAPPAGPPPPGTGAAGPPAGTGPAPGAPFPVGPGWPPPPPGWRPGMPVPPGYGVPPGSGFPPNVALPPRGYPYLLVRPRPHGLPVAPLGLRFLARLIDIVAVLALNALGNGWFVYLWVKDVGPVIATAWRAAMHNQTGVDLPAIPGRGTMLGYVIPLVAMALWWAYEVPSIANAGQTFGKRVVGIKVMALEKEEPIGLRRAFRRWTPLGLPVLLWTCGIGFVLQLVDCISPALGGPLQLALHDRSAQTVVVHCGRRGHEKTPEKVPAKTGGET